MVTWWIYPSGCLGGAKGGISGILHQYLLVAKGWSWWSCPLGRVGGVNGGVGGLLHQNKLVGEKVELVELSTKAIGWKSSTSRLWWNIVHLLGGVCGPPTFVEISTKKFCCVQRRDRNSSLLTYLLDAHLVK